MPTDRTNIDELCELSVKELDTRIADAVVRIETRAAVAYDSGRKTLTSIEQADFDRDYKELESLREAVAIAEHRERQHSESVAAVGAAIGQQRGGISPIMLSRNSIETLEKARAEMRSVSVIEERAALTTTVLGTAVEYGGTGLAAPRNLWRASGISTSEPPAGYQAVVPQYSIPSGVALVSESSPHAEFDDVTPDDVQLLRTGSWSDLSAEAAISSSVAEVSTAHARVIARDLDLAMVSKLEAADSGLTVDEAMLTVADEAAVDVSALWIVGDVASMAALIGNAVFAPAGGPDMESFASRYGGARCYVTGAATALTVFAPSGFRCFATRLATGLVVDPTTGQQRFGSWLIFGVGQSLAGAAVTVGGGS